MAGKSWKRISIGAFALLLGCCLILALPFHAAANNPPTTLTDQLEVSATIVPVCSLLTPEKIYDLPGWGERMRLWKMFIFCTAGENYLISLNAFPGNIFLDPNPAPGDSDLTLETLDGEGTGDWEPLFLYSDDTGSSGWLNGTLQLTLVY